MKSSILIFLGALTWFLPLGLSAQGVNDVLLWSPQHVHGTSRFNAMGGAFSALGGDMGALHVNPAAAGVFTKSEFSFTPGLGNTGIESSFYNNFELARSGRINMNNLGVLFVSELNNPNWKTLNIGVSYTRTNNFNENMVYEGEQSNHSFAQHLVNRANSIGPNGTPISVDNLGNADPFQAFPAYQTYVIDYDNVAEEYYTVIEQNQPVTQRGEIQRTGRTSETMLSLGANYNDRVFIGVGLKLGSLVVQERFDFNESPENEEFLVSHNYRYDLEVRGSSFSASGGVIAWLTNFLRMGVSVQTPHFYVNNESFGTGMTSQLAGEYAAYAGGTTFSHSAGPFPNRYNFNTPWRFGGGLAGVLGKKALISADYDYIDFSTSSLGRNRRSASNYDYSAENDDISAVLRAAHHVRAGFEYRFFPVSVRAGYAYSQNPVNTLFSQANRDIHRISAGAGVRHKKVYFDAAFWYGFTNSEFTFYSTGLNDSAQLDQNHYGISLTFGVRY